MKKLSRHKKAKRVEKRQEALETDAMFEGVL